MHSFDRLSPHRGDHLLPSIDASHCRHSDRKSQGEEVPGPPPAALPITRSAAPSDHRFTDWGRRKSNGCIIQAADDPLTPALVRNLREYVVQGRIMPSVDGLGGYLVWIEILPSGISARVWRCLTHEDGAPLRFPDAVQAHDKAVDCHLDPAKVAVRWPPGSI